MPLPMPNFYDDGEALVSRRYSTGHQNLSGCELTLCTVDLLCAQTVFKLRVMKRHALTAMFFERAASYNIFHYRVDRWVL